MPKPIKFRKAALKEFTSPEHLDQLIQVVTPRSWLIAGTLYFIVLVVILWSIFGNIPTRVEGQGILLAGGGDIFNAVAPDGPSHIATLLVKVGSEVKKDQVIATLSRPDLLDQIKVTQLYLSDLQQQKIQLEILSKNEISARQKNIQTQKEVLQRTITTSQEKLKHSGELLAIKQAAFKKGLEVRQNVEQTFQEYSNVKNELQNYNDKLVQLDITESDFIDQWNERLRELTLKITDETVKLNHLQTRLKLSSDVKSPVNGTITDIRATLGSIVKVGEPVLSIASEGKDLDALVFLPPKDGKRVKVGMQALISPNTIEKAEYGSVHGKVIHVGEFPATSHAMLAALQNPELVKQFSNKEVPITIRIQLQKDTTTMSGFKWSSSKGPSVKITPGTLVRAWITVREQAPITLVIPTLKKITGLE